MRTDEPDIMEACVFMVVMCLILFFIFAFDLSEDMKEKRVKIKTTCNSKSWLISALFFILLLTLPTSCDIISYIKKTEDDL